MKRSLYLGIVLAIIAAAYWAGSRTGRQSVASHETQGSRQILYYVDPMNPAHTSAKPGKAPCGMDMEPVYADAAPGFGSESSSAPTTPGTVKVSLDKQQLIGLRVGRAAKKPLTGTIRLPGKVAVDETRIYRINATVDGWITRALPLSAGSQVKRDETLAQFYSPEFLAASQALIYALVSADRAKPTGQETEIQRSQMANFDLNLKQYRDALRNLGMGELQIQEVIHTRQRVENVNITSPANGFILARNVSDGQRFDKGTELFRIADLSHIWILVDVFEKDAALIAPNEAPKVRLPNQAKTFTATVSDTLPQFDNVSRTLKLRLEAENPETLLKPDMFVDVELPVSLAESVVVPVDAVLGSDLGQFVFLDSGNGYFEPRRVQTGAELNGQVQILGGLMVDERIVVSGNFLLDSESRMKLAAAHLQEKSKPIDPVCKMSVDEAKAKAAGRSSEHGGKTYYFCNDGCKQQFDKNPAEFLGQPKPASIPGAVAQPGRATDLVCGMTVNEEKARAANRVVNFAGKTHYFCNDSCQEQFTKNPVQFLGEAKPHGMPALAAQPARSNDPVCGMPVTEEKAQAANRVVDFGGKTYFFCNDSCKEEFTADPKKFLAAADAKIEPMPGPEKTDESSPSHSH